MASYSYSAINAQGAELTGEIVAPDLAGAREQLRLKGLLAESLREISGSDGPKTGVKLGGKVKPKSLQVFSRQFATMIEAGLNVVGSLVILEEQTDDPALATVVRQLRSDVEGGLLLSEAMLKHNRVFSRLYVAMVEAGEAAGILDIVLDRVAFQIEKQEGIRRKIKSAMVYPTMVIIFATLVLIGMLLFLVPIFQGIFAQLNGQLPTLTQYVVDASNLLKGAPWVLLFIPLGLWSFFRWKRTESGRKLWDRFKLRIPMKIGETVRKVTMARFSRTLSTLVAAGVDIIKALEITGQTAGNWVVEEALAGVRVKVHEGVPIAQPLIENPVFPPMVSQMVKIGEETGELEKMLTKIADFYEEEVDASVASLTSIIEPLMMIGVGIMVGIILIAMYLPMFKMLHLVSGS
ncbi:MAG TPA: type II secretion system F family protein [Gaiellaceae bacterium]|nr:type II secretion system F family protein [Gaiellaceae bacterium]